MRRFAFAMIIGLVQVGVTMFDMTREPDTNPTQNNWVRVDCKRVSGQSELTHFDTINKLVRFGLSHIVVYP